MARPPLTEAQEDYLKHLFLLEEALGGPVPTQALAERLSVKPPSVTEMLKKLKALGLLEHEPYRGARLTERGRKVALEVLRQPLEDGEVTISRSAGKVTLPCSFMLVAAMNPCPCGYFNHPTKTCSCPAGAVEKYLNRVSGPLLDRIDLHVEVTPVTHHELDRTTRVSESNSIRERVLAARDIQKKRYQGFTNTYTNAQISNKELAIFCPLDANSKALLAAAMEKLNLSARAYHRIIKVSRTIADLAGAPNILPEHIAEAVQYRTLDRANWSASGG